MIIGAQLYTLRNYCKTLEDFALTMKRTADIGYTTVQVSGTCSYQPEWLAQQLKKNGLKCVITHYNPDRIAEDTDTVISEHDVFDCKYIGLGSVPWKIKEDEDYNKFVKKFKPAAKKIAESGKYFMYHNHQFEFSKSADNKLYLQKMSEDFEPDIMGFTLDTYWIQFAGGDPAEWIEKFSGRVPCIHLKDMECENSAQKMAPVGDGNINFKRVLYAAQNANTEYLLVEQDDCYGKDPFECLKRSYQYLIAQGLK